MGYYVIIVVVVQVLKVMAKKLVRKALEMIRRLATEEAQDEEVCVAFDWILISFRFVERFYVCSFCAFIFCAAVCRSSCVYCIRLKMSL